MFSTFLKRFSGRSNRKWLKSCEPIVAKINELESSYQSLSEAELKSHTAKFRERFQAGESLDDLLPEAFATVKNASRRLCGTTPLVRGRETPWDMIHYDVQLIGGMALHQGRIAEMATGEGKTLVSTLPIYLNAMSGRNVQLVTVNEYLAQRDAEWMGYLFKYLGLTVGCIMNQMRPPEKREMYGCDITYGTASEFGFDYLRDNGMAHSKEEQVQRDHFFCIIDEVDSILVDEARTPLIISGPAQIQREQPYTKLKPGVERLVNQQNKLCNQIIAEVKDALEKPDADRWELSMKMLQVKVGMPKNKLLLRLLETGEYRKMLDKADLEMNSDLNKDKYFHLKEELYYTIDEKQRQADLTEKGRSELRPDDPDAFMLPDLATFFSELDKDAGKTQEEKDAIKLAEQEKLERVGEDIHAISQLLRAYALYERDVEYVVQEGKVVIVDENTGRVMPGRRWGDGLHQAVEAKENVTIERETRTYATITVQNYFRMYDKLAGMTGTAETEATEFHDIYKLGVAVIPPNKPCIRVDENDVIYKSRREKYNAVIDELEAAHKKGQPVLVGTVSVEASELLGRMLKRRNIPHNVLNAKFHQQEAEIVARAGMKGAVTIATNMAGRGTDIKLGEGVKDIGGLLVLGTERHESRRIDRQLRGRCSRQGDPGRSKFFISLEDDLMRLFANSGFMAKMLHGSMQEGEPLEHPLLNRSIETAQKKVEQGNYSVRKRLLQYDDVLNQQREIIYGIRNQALHGDAPIETVFELIEEEIANRLDEASGTDFQGFVSWANLQFPIGLKEEDLQSLKPNAQLELVLGKIREAYRIKKTAENEEALLHLERYVLLSAIDARWQEHLTEMEDLRRNVGLRSYGQKDPLLEYKNEAYTYFEELMGNVRVQICSRLFRTATNLVAIENVKMMLARQAVAAGGGSGVAPVAAQSVGNRPAKPDIKLPKVNVSRNLPKVGRNDPCPCGSGKKFKQCCGR